MDSKQQGFDSKMPPASNNILMPPTWATHPGQLVPWSATTEVSNSKFQICGTDSQVVQICLAKGESINSEPGCMIHMGDPIKMHTNCGQCCKCCGGVSLFRNTYKNHGEGPAYVTLGPNFPGKVIPIDLSKSGPIHSMPGLYFGGIGEVNVSLKLVKNCGAACFGGGGFILLRITGKGTVFLTGGGTVMEKILSQGETLMVDTHSVVGFSSTVEYGISSTGGCTNCLCGGVGCFNTKLTGPGLVIVQSFSKKRYINSLGLPKEHHQAEKGAATAQ